MKKTNVTEKKHNKGFTLLELLIAIAVFAVMSAMAYGGLSNVILNSTHSEAALERIQAVQHAVFVVTRDLTQIVSRDIRDEFGNAQSYLNTNNIDFLLEFTRSGRRNPAKLKRSNLLRVAYKYEDKTMSRLFWPQLDRVQGMEPYETVLLDKVTQVELRYLDASNEWQTQWPPGGTPQQGGAAVPKPVAIEFKIELEDWGEIVRIFRVGV
jgi:general secretion pathway protein J